jgi:quercetin dioxygenase-like cupin family protein
MIRTTITAASLLLVGFITQVVLAEQAERKPEPIASEVLLQASSSWKGDQYKYPQGTPLITVKTVLFQPGAKSKPHSHDMPGAAMIQEGELLCEVPATGRVKRFVERDVLPTTFKNDLHTCENTGTEVAKVLVFYAGAVGLSTSYYIQK